MSDTSDSSSDELSQIVRQSERHLNRLTRYMVSEIPSPLDRALTNRYNFQHQVQRLTTDLDNIPLPTNMEPIPVQITQTPASTIYRTFYEFRPAASFRDINFPLPEPAVIRDTTVLHESIRRLMNGDRSWADHTANENLLISINGNVPQIETAISSNNNRPTEAAQTSENIPTINLVGQQIPTIDLISSDESRPPTPTPQTQDTPVTNPMPAVSSRVVESPPLRCRLRPRAPISYAPYKRNARAAKRK